MILLNLGYENKVDKMICRWINSASRDKSHAYAIPIVYSISKLHFYSFINIYSKFLEQKI